MTDFLSLIRQRFERNRDVPLAKRLHDDASFVMEIALGRVWLRDCDKVGSWIRILNGRPRVENGGHIEIGDRCRLYCSFAPVELRTAPGGSLLIGESASINFGTILDATRLVKIGNNVDIGPYCIIADSETPGETGDGAAEPEPIEIGDGAWIASRVTVLPGARIGAGAVITAGSIVSGDIPPRVVAGGSPARVLRRIDANGNGAPEPAPIEAAPETSRAAVPRREPKYRGLLISDFTIDDLARCLADEPHEPALSASVAPFGQVVPTLMSPPPPDTDYAVVWTRAEVAVPSFAKLLEYESVELGVLLSEVDQFASLLARGLASYRFAAVVTWTLPPWQRGFGAVDTRDGGVARALAAMNARLMERLSQASNVFVLPAERWISNGKGGYSAKLWYLGKVPFAPAVFEHAATDIKAAISGVLGMARKLVIVDLDDTLWGGIVGDAGWEELRLGGHDSVGEAFVDFQRALKNLKRRGVVLGIVSKNEESVALEAIRRHPEMVLREEDFVGHRINWQDKARNIADLAAALNLGLQSVVFIDDNPFERTRVREALPEVYVPEWPEDKTLYPSALLSLTCFDAPRVSAEDLARTAMYASEREREQLKVQVGSVDDWLRSLEIRVRAEPLGAQNLARTAQLLNKTNQMNLSTRRLTEAELSAWAAEPGSTLVAITVSDRLGDAGLTGILSLKAHGETAKIVDFVLSCRVMGRRVEQTMAHLAVAFARRAGATRVVADLVPTAKNKPCLTFFQESGFRKEGETTFVWDVTGEYALPDVITLDVRG